MVTFLFSSHDGLVERLGGNEVHKNFCLHHFLGITINDLTSFGGKLALKMIYCRVRQITPTDVGDSPNFLFGFKDFFSFSKQFFHQTIFKH